MLTMKFGGQGEDVFRVLCLGAHSDDIEIGCGGTVLKLQDQIPSVEFYWVVLSASNTRAEEARVSADRFLQKASRKTIEIMDFRDGFFPYLGIEIKEFFEGMKQRFSPDLVLTHFRHDMHQDHRMVSDLTWNTFRNHMILEYEIAKYDGDLGNPNFYVHLQRDQCEEKIEQLWTCFESQHDRQWFTADTFRSLLRLRGIESNADEGYAEGFHCRKLVI